MMFSSIDKSTSIGIRDYAILELLYGCGLRVSELCNLEIKDIDFSEAINDFNGFFIFYYCCWINAWF